MVKSDYLELWNRYDCVERVRRGAIVQNFWRCNRWDITEYNSSWEELSEKSLLSDQSQVVSVKCLFRILLSGLVEVLYESQIDHFVYCSRCCRWTVSSLQPQRVQKVQRFKAERWAGGQEEGRISKVLDWKTKKEVRGYEGLPYHLDCCSFNELLLVLLVSLPDTWLDRESPNSIIWEWKMVQYLLIWLFVVFEDVIALVDFWLWNWFRPQLLKENYLCFI